MRCLLAVMLVAGCRIGFDPLATTDGSSDTGPVTYREAVLADHPISYWRLDGTSTSIVDVQQNIDGVFTGTCTYGVAGALAQDSNTAVHFDGQTCEGSFGDNFRFPGTAPMTIELWVRPANPSVSAYEHYFTVETRNPGAVDGYAIFRESGAKVERVVAVATVKTAPFDLLADVWYHMAMVYDGTVTQLYVDGALAQEQADARAINVTGAPALIGAQSAGGWFAGDMDEIAVYDVALPPSRLALHHQIGVSGPQ